MSNDASLLSKSTEAPKPSDTTSPTHSTRKRRRVQSRAQQSPVSPSQARPLFPDVSTVANNDPELLGEWARENAAFLKARGWFELARDRQDRSAISENVVRM